MPVCQYDCLQFLKYYTYYQQGGCIMQDWSISSKPGTTPVYLNVYSFCHCCNIVCGCLGLGVYHTAIEMFDIQFMFHGWAGNHTGVCEVEPRTAPYRFQKQILLGNIDQSFSELDNSILQPLRQEFISNKYDLFNNNCNHFAEALAKQLGFGYRNKYAYIFRLTDIANLFRCCLPACLLSGRLDWFTSKQKREAQLQQIRNSQIKHSNSSRYWQLAEQPQELKEETHLENRPMAGSNSSRKQHPRPKIFKNSNSNY